MFKQFFSLLITFIFGTNSPALAQAYIVPNCEEPAENCPSACIFCNLVNYTGNSGLFGPDPAPPGWCSNIQNDQWIGFVAGQSSLTITVIPSNCIQGQGLQIAVYEEGCNAEPLVCNPGCATCGNTPVVFNMTDLVVGANYFILIDGYSADACDFTISITPEGAAMAPPIGIADAPSGPNSICVAQSAVFGIPAVSGANYYRWESSDSTVLFNGIPSPAILSGTGATAPTVSVGFIDPGSLDICVTPLNSCQTGATKCTTINIEAVPVMQYPTISLCASEFPYTLPWGETVTAGGVYSILGGTGPSGCDSIFRQELITLPNWNIGQTIYLCNGACATVEGVEYCASGTYTTTLTSQQGCDSTFTLTVHSVIADAGISGNASIACGDTITLYASGNSVRPPGGSIMHLWYNEMGGVDNGDSLLVTLPGMYIHQVTIMAGGTVVCSDADTVTVLAAGNPLIISSVTTAPVNNENNGTINLLVNGGSGYYGFEWTLNGNNFAQTEDLANLAPGLYEVTVTDLSNGCTQVSFWQLESITGTNAAFTDNALWQISPNPGTGLFMLQYQGKNPGEIHIEIMDAAGKQIRSSLDYSETKTIPIDLTPYPDGSYLIQLIGAKANKVMRLVKQQ